MRVGNIFSHVCLCVCVFVQVITFKLLRPGTSFSVYTDTIKISGSSLSTKVMKSGLRSNKTDFSHNQSTSLYSNEVWSKAKVI